MPLNIPGWIERLPLVESIRVELPPPHLDDNTGDLDRLLRKLKEMGYSKVQIQPASLSTLVGRIREGAFSLTVIVGYTPCHWELIDVLPGFRHDPPLGFGVDLGTSRLAFYLVNLQTGEILDETSIDNPQIPHGEDILTRILFARREENRIELQRLLVEAFNAAMGSMAARLGLSRDGIYAVAVAGNTTMSHFLLALDPCNICKEPYIPAVNRFPFFRAADLGLQIHPRGLVFVFPNVGSYFGGDLTAGILAAGFHRSDDVSILVDVGTNAEVVVGNRDWLIACAGAAGPALEGGVVERGMMAAPGAIDRVRIDPETLEVSYHVLGDVAPAGICGSGLIDLIAEMFNAGILTIQGRINRRLESPRIVSSGDGTAFVVVPGRDSADGRDIVVSDIDVGIFLKSKAAMFTILSVIIRKVGLTFGDLRKFYVAGTFGNYIDPAMAIRIGMIPDLPLETFEGLGNTAGRGAVMILLDRSLLDELERVCNIITYIELNVNMELMNEFRGALFLPHTDPRLFPSVRIPERAMAGV